MKPNFKNRSPGMIKAEVNNHLYSEWINDKYSHFKEKT